MVTLVIVVFIVIVLSVLVLIKAKMKKMARKADPIESIDFQGCLGINLGDSWDFVLNRMLHLKLITTDKFTEYHAAYLKDGDSFMESLVGRFIAQERYKNIEELEFCIKYGVLDNIYLKFGGEHTDIDGVVMAVRDKLRSRLGNPKENKDGSHFYMWIDEETGRMLILSDVDHDLLLTYGG